MSYFFYCDCQLEWFFLTLSDGCIVATNAGIAQFQSLRPYEYDLRTDQTQTGRADAE